MDDWFKFVKMISNLTQIYLYYWPKTANRNREIICVYVCLGGPSGGSEGSKWKILLMNFSRIYTILIQRFSFIYFCIHLYFSKNK